VDSLFTKILDLPRELRLSSEWLVLATLVVGADAYGQRAAAITSLVHSARLNGHEPHAYLKDVLERLPTQPARRIGELLPHRWRTVASH
jgi:transposase